MARKLLWASLALTPVTLVANWVFDAGDVLLFVLAAGALIPLAWLIGEATDHAAGHTGPGIGGFLNATFGNAPELIIALFAVSSSLPNVVRGSITGSVVSNILLVLGAALFFGREGAIDRRSSVLQLGLVLFAVAAFLVPSIPGWDGDPERHSLAVATVPVAIVLMLVYVGLVADNLRRHRRLHLAATTEPVTGWSLPIALLALTAATTATAFVSEVLVHELDAFAESLGLSEFLVAAVIVAIVGNAAEHGGAVVIARRGSEKVALAAEIAISSSAQVAVLVAPAVALLSFVVRPTLPLSFRPVELATMAGAAALVLVVLRDGHGSRRDGLLLFATYGVVVAVYAFVGDR